MLSRYRLGVTGIETDTDGSAPDSVPRSAEALDAELQSLGITPDVDRAASDVVTQPAPGTSTHTEHSTVGGVEAPDPTRPPTSKRRRKVSKWDRPPPPKDWRWYVGHVGRVLIAIGVLMFAFVAYQLWGTGIENARAQAALEDDFEELLAEFDPPSTPATDDTLAEPSDNADVDDSSTGDSDSVPADDGADDVSTGADDPADEIPGSDVRVAVIPAEEQNIPLFDDGDALAKIEIPDIGVSDIVVAGIQVSDLKRGPGHFPDTPMPGQLGNAAIAGHRTTYGQPFFRVDELEPGDEIRVTTLNGEFTYLVTGTSIVQPSDYQVVATTDPTKATLTLVSCHPRYTARQRIIVSAELDTEASGTVGEPVLNYRRPDEEPTAEALPDEGDDVADDAPATAPDDSDPGADTGADDLPADQVATDDTSAEPEAATDDDLLAEPVEQEIADVFGKGWFSDPAANPQVGLWGLALTAIAVLAYLISRRVRRDWVGLMVGVVPFVVTLYFFFQNVNRLLPPNL